jgi:tetratricopeptide (TPR) repeat protein
VTSQAKSQTRHLDSAGLRLVDVWPRCVLLALLIFAVFMLLHWVCITDPKLNFLPTDKRAQWILFPAPVNGGVHRIVSLDATFRRAFTLDRQPKLAKLEIRAARRLELKINEAPIAVGNDSNWNWKKVTKIDVAQFLHAGSNLIEARVFNDSAPPALWLALSADQFHLQTGPEWEAKFSGSDWRHTVLASNTRFPGPGNPSAGGERTSQCIAVVWQTWLLLGGVALFGWVMGSILIRLPRWGTETFSTILPIASLAGAGAFWLMLFWHNAGPMPLQEGFDSTAHLDYIKYIQERRSLPLPSEGFEMFQPPLYYVLSAAALSACHVAASEPSGILVLRALTILFGIAHFTFVFLTLRLLCPGRIDAQLVGFLIAASLPMHLYLSQFVTNETLAAALISAAIYIAVRILQSEPPSWFQLGLIGALLGAAILAKTTGLLLIPALLLGMAIKLSNEKSHLRDWLFCLGVPLAVCFAVCGWHFIRFWYRLGAPLVGNWDVASGFSWWQDPGFRTVFDYFRFGRSLIAPIFSSFAGVPDGIYSTIWGDALCAGTSDLTFRPPWNYPAMVGGYLLALVPTFMILVGAIVVLHRSLKGPSAAASMVLGFSGLMVLTVAFMTVRVASYAQVKAFYGLSVLSPICFFGAVGWNAITRGHKFPRLVLGVLLLIFAMNAFLSFWIPSSASQHVYTASRLLVNHNTQAAAVQIQQALRLDASDVTAWRLQSMIANELNEPYDALHDIEHAVQVGPNDSASHVQLAFLLRSENQMERASDEARRAVELGPENPFAYPVLTNCLLGLGRTNEAFAVAREGLAVLPFSAELHYQLGLVAAEKGDFVAAINQFSYALLLEEKRTEGASKMLSAAIQSLSHSQDRAERLYEAITSIPDCPDALSQLGWLLATSPDDSLRNGPEAVRLTQRACTLTSSKNALMLANLAAAYAETGKFSEAVTAVQQAATEARAQNDTLALSVARKLLGAFRENRPFRDDSH